MNIHVCMHVAVCVAVYTFPLRVVGEKLGKKKERKKKIRLRDTQLVGFISRFFHATEMHRAAPTNCGESPRNASERRRDALRILKNLKDQGARKRNDKRVSSTKLEFLY